MSDTPISDSTPHNVAELGMLCRRLERELNEMERLASVRLSYIKLIESQNDAANERIKRMEEALDKTSKAACKHIKQLESEVYALRLYGNKDCTAMADQALKEAKP